MILTKIKKINKRTRKNKIIHSTPIFDSLIILVTCHTIFASFYFALLQYIHDIDWNTLNLEMAVWLGDLPSPLMAIFFLEICLSTKAEHSLVFFIAHPTTLYLLGEDMVEKWNGILLNNFLLSFSILYVIFWNCAILNPCYEKIKNNSVDTIEFTSHL